MSSRKTIGYGHPYTSTMYDDQEPRHWVRRYDDRWCVEGVGVRSEGDATVDDEETAEALRALIQQAYHRGREDGARAKVREFRALLGL